MPHTALAPRRSPGPAAILAELLDAAERGPISVPPEERCGRLPVSYWALAERNGEEFVRLAFVDLLGREPDEAALAFYAEALASGALAKAAILGRIRYSKEGRLIGANVPGLRPRHLLRQLTRVPVLGRLMQVVNAVLTLPRLERDLQRLEQMAHADHARLDRLERVAAAAGPQLGQRVGQAEARLQEVGALSVRLSALERRLDPAKDG